MIKKMCEIDANVNANIDTNVDVNVDVNVNANVDANVDVDANINASAINYVNFTAGTIICLLSSGFLDYKHVHIFLTTCKFTNQKWFWNHNINCTYITQNYNYDHDGRVRPFCEQLHFGFVKPTELKFIGWIIRDALFVQLKSLQLKSLIFKDCMFNMASFLEIFKNSSLKSLELHINNYNNYYEIYHDKWLLPYEIITNLKKIPMLTKLKLVIDEHDINEHHINEYGINRSLTNNGLTHLKKLPLVSLECHYCKSITDEGLKNFEHLPLEHLNFSDCSSITGAALINLKNVRLKSLIFNSCGSITDVDLENLKNMTSLTYLVINQCHNINITNKGIEHLKHLPLTHLEIDGHWADMECGLNKCWKRLGWDNKLGFSLDNNFA